MKNNWFEDKHQGLLIGILLIFSYFILMFGNSIVSLTHPDEVFYIQSAKEMLAYNSWLTPMIFDGVQFEKPFLPFTLFMLAIKWFGLTSFAGRFWPSISGIGAVLVVYWITWNLFRNKRTAFLAGFILATSFIHLALSRAVLTDAIFSLFIASSIGFFIHAYYNRKYKDLGIILWLCFAAIAVLTKGLLGMLFPIVTVLMFLIYKKDMIFLKSKAILWGSLLFLVIALPWHILMYVQHGQWFLSEYFYNVHWRRILMSEHAKLDNWYFYLMLMFVGVMPWFLFWIPTIKCVYTQFKKKMASRDKLFFLLSWIICVYVFVQPAHSKLASYIFPLFPAIAILIAYAINNALERAEQGEQTGLFKTVGYLMAFILLCIVIGGNIVARHYSDIVLDLMPIYLFSGFLLSIGAVLFFSAKTRRYSMMVFSCSGVTVALLMALFFARPFIEPWVSCKEISDIFKKYDTSDTPVLASKFYVRGIRFYTDRSMAVIDVFGHGFWSPHPIPFLNSDKKVSDFLNARPITWAILKEGNIRDLERIIHARGVPVKLTQYENVGGKYIIKIEKIR